MTGTTSWRGAGRNALMLLFLCVGTAPALADKIDGDWCSADGQRLHIDGPRIITPGGTAMAGLYERHFFSYTVPVPEKHAGSRIQMSQQDEETMFLRRETGGGSIGKVETWRRCEATS